MAKMKNDYFALMTRQVSCCVEASARLSAIVSGYCADTIAVEKEKMHAIEHKADEIHHDIRTRLSTEFITPIDQEDILHLTQIIDDVTDALDEVALDCYMFRMASLPAQVVPIAALVGRCVDALAAAVGELKSFKKPERLHRLLIDVNTIEGEGDAAFAEAIRALFGSESDCRTLIGAKAIYEGLENCCDLCEHAADVIEQIIVKNT